MTDIQNSNNYHDYVARINRVLDYIDKNLSKNISLRDLADEANFSPYHFHRIFHAFVGETLAQFILRLRLEKAADRLIREPHTSVTTIALECGFSSSASFARAYKDFFGINASEWRAGIFPLNSKNSKTKRNLREIVRKDRKDFTVSSMYLNTENQQLTWRIGMKTSKLTADVKVKQVPEMTVAYVRNIGQYKGNSALFEKLIGKLCRWAGPRRLLGKDTKTMAIYHDNPDLTPEDKLRLSIAIEIPEDTRVSGEVGKMTIPAGQYAMARFELGENEYQEAWNLLYAGWLPESGYQPADGPCYELYLNDPKDHPQNKCIVDICISVKPL